MGAAVRTVTRRVALVCFALISQFTIREQFWQFNPFGARAHVSRFHAFSYAEHIIYSMGDVWLTFTSKENVV